MNTKDCEATYFGDSCPSQRKFDNENDAKTKGLIALWTHKAIFEASQNKYEEGNILTLKSKVLGCKITVKFDYHGKIRNKEDLSKIREYLTDIIENN